MKLFMAAVVLAGIYLYGILHTTDTVLGQTKQLNATYQYVANNSDEIVIGK